MSDREGVTAVNGAARVSRGIGAAILAAAMSWGCNVIKPDLLGDDAGGSPSSPPRDAAAIDAAAVDASPDAYAPAVGNLVSNPDFEAGAMGWINNGGGMVLPWSNAAHTGAGCLLTNERTAHWNGPAVSLTAKVRRGKHYAMSAWVRLADAGTEGFQMSVRHTCAEDGQHFNTGWTPVAQPHVTDNASWVQPMSSFIVVDSPDCTLTELLVYVETTTDPAASYPAFYLDDVEVNEIVP